MKLTRQQVLEFEKHAIAIGLKECFSCDEGERDSREKFTYDSTDRLYYAPQVGKPNKIEMEFGVSTRDVDVCVSWHIDNKQGHIHMPLDRFLEMSDWDVGIYRDVVAQHRREHADLKKRLGAVNGNLKKYMKDQLVSGTGVQRFRP